MSATPYSVLDLAPVLSNGTVADAFRRTVDLARHAEGWGYNRLWLAEHHNMPGIASSATSVLIGHVAGATKTIRVGSGGVMLPNHAPLVIAEQFGTLEALYPGRIDLGLGRAPGSDQLTARALMRDPGAGERFPDMVWELRAFLGPSSPGQKLRAVPGENSNVPVWLLGSSTFSARLAARLGLPFAFAGQFAPQQMFDALHLYREGFRPSELWPKPYAMIGMPMLAADTDEEAGRLATSSFQQILALHRGQPIHVPPPLDSLGEMDDIWTPAERAGVESHFGAAIIGGPETVKRKLAKFLEVTQADELMFHGQFYDHAARLRSYEIAAEVMRSF